MTEFNDPTPTPRPGEYYGPDRRAFTQGSNVDLLAGLPVWARVLLVVGIPGGIAVFLVWVGANDLPRIAREVATSNQQITVLLNEQRKLQEQSEATFRMLQRICSNTAKTDTDRQRCFDR